MSGEVGELDRVLGTLPEGWREVALSDVADVNPETLRASTSPDYAFGYIDISQIEGPGQCAGWTEQTFGGAPSRARRKVRSGDILVSTVRPYLRSFAQVPEADLPLVASTGFAVVRHGADADQQFLYQHILHSSFIEHLTPRMTGSNYPAVSAGDVEAYPISLPPLDEQRRIAEVLRSVDEAISAAGKVVVQAKSNLDAATTGLVGMVASSSAWRYGRCDSFFVLQRGFDITEKQASPGPYRVISSSGPTYWHTASAVEGPAVITGRKGRLGTVFYSDEDCWPHDTTLWVKDFKGNHPRFVYWKLREMDLKSHDAATSVPTLNRNNVHAVKIAFPPLTQQTDISETLDAMLSSIKWGEGHLSALNDLKSCISRDLLGGHARVPA